MAETRGSYLRFCIAFALRGVRLQLGLRFPKLDLTEEQRYAAADRTIETLRQRHGYSTWLDEVEEAKSNGPHWELRQQMKDKGLE